MHKYDACPSDGHEVGPGEGPQFADVAQIPVATPADLTPEDSSPLPCSRPSSDCSASDPPGTQEEDLGMTGQTLPPKSSRSTSSEILQPVLGGYSKRQTAWRLQTVVIGFYVLSLLLVVCHYMFFLYLEGRVMAPSSELSYRRTTMIPQGYVTTISLLLTTAFRATLVASVASCYTQYLWATLRTRVLKVGLVEDLFQIQTNAFHLASPNIYIKTPILAAVAIFCWLVPIATVYPPGALVVELHNLLVDTCFNVSVLHGKNYSTSWSSLPLSTIQCWDEDRQLVILFDSDLENAQNASFLNTCRAVWGQTRDVAFIARSSLMSGEISGLTQPSGENSSYALQFWGTTLDCQTVNRTIGRNLLPADGELEGNSFLVKNVSTYCRIWSDGDWNARFEDLKSVNHVAEQPTEWQYYPCLDLSSTTDTDQRFSLPETGINFLVQAKETVCRPKLTAYLVNISFTAGKQHISYTLNDSMTIPAYSAAFEHFNGSFEQWVHFSDAASLYWEFAASMNRAVVFDMDLGFRPTNSTQRSTLQNGTTLETCLPHAASQWSGNWRPGHEPWTLDFWPLSVFERRAPDIGAQKEMATCPNFNVEIAKELLINTTISAISLNKSFETVNGTVSRTFNIYRFRNKLAFFLPYSLSIGLGVPIIALGLISFYTRNNKTSAISGGFLQLLMTTTGRTSLEKLISGSGTLGGYENVSDGLKAADISFGELIETYGDVSERASTMNAGSDSTMGHSSSTDVVLHGNLERNQGVNDALNTREAESNERRERRIGFGLAQEVNPLSRRNVRDI
ncbi:hypothetical protein C7974DRAFT_387870 [Boeremia exigua]|uniref:uncharacterized protein n=1 Tax=Boeremia exigua TaxID=749465 RepID=UPI001E8D6A10|nr:uncharacterized protein C7974DRAFT_387870 [Boeremia exigua]KAH6639095.1 hypothetical protein C7974DRAFT_387870 [Boeremia exigua]